MCKMFSCFFVEYGDEDGELKSGLCLEFRDGLEVGVLVLMLGCKLLLI